MKACVSVSKPRRVVATAVVGWKVMSLGSSGQSEEYSPGGQAKVVRSGWSGLGGMVQVVRPGYQVWVV